MLIAVLFAIWLPTFGLGGSDMDNRVDKVAKGQKMFRGPCFRQRRGSAGGRTSGQGKSM